MVTTRGQWLFVNRYRLGGERPPDANGGLSVHIGDHRRGSRYGTTKTMSVSRRRSFRWTTWTPRLTELEQQ